MNEYKPDKVSSPGETFKDWLDQHNMTVEQAVELFHPGGDKNSFSLSCKIYQSFIDGTYGLHSKDGVASLVATITGIPAEFWLERQRLYNESLIEKELK